MFNFFRKEHSKEEKQPPKKEDFSNIEHFISYIKDETGIDFFNKKDIVKNKLRLFCKKKDIYSFEELLDSIKKNIFLKQEVIDYLTVNETYFFRETKQIEEMIKQAKTLGSKVEILCAPSSSGDEPYTIAIMMLEAGFKPADFHIVGIDISETIINKAKLATYRERNLHKISKELKEKYFFKDDKQYIVKDVVKNQVSFRRINIFDKSLQNLRKFDFIFSRNMMIYFDHETKIKAKNILSGLLKREGDCIYFGHADMLS